MWEIMNYQHGKVEPLAKMYWIATTCQILFKALYVFTSSTFASPWRKCHYYSHFTGGKTKTQSAYITHPRLRELHRAGRCQSQNLKLATGFRACRLCHWSLLWSQVGLVVIEVPSLMTCVAPVIPFNCSGLNGLIYKVAMLCPTSACFCKQ